MSVLLLFFALIISTNEKIMEQGTANVPLSDLDAYVYRLAPEKRAGFINDKVQIEKNLITMMNLNIVNDYIRSSDLIKHKAFNNVDHLVSEMPIDLDDEFYLKLGLDKKIAHKNVRQFIAKREMFSRMSDYIEYEYENGLIENYIKEKFQLNYSKYIKDEKRDISLIELDGSKYDLLTVKEILKSLLADDNFENFGDYAVNYSTDMSVDINQGHLKAFRESDFKYPFSKAVFKQTDSGVVPSIFKHNQNYFLVRINKIIPRVLPEYNDYRDEIAKQVLPELVDNRLQAIINTQARNKVKVNPEVMAHVFERYKVLLEE